VKPDTILFDLDGTLADTAGDIAASVAHAMGASGLVPPPREAVVAAIGAGVRKLIERLVGDASKRDAVLAGFLAHYGEHLLDRTRLYPGVAETLAVLDATRVVVTNKPEAFSRTILDRLGVARLFRAIVGGDSLPVRKPDPAIVARVLAAVGGTRAWIVGDSGTDVATAKAARIPVVAVTYGYHKPGELDGADWVVDRFEAIAPLWRSYTRGE
jgi:phosphoglycolate phosphatase